MNLQLNPPEPNIDKENPWADDALQREECAKRLTQVIEGQIEPLTISINGSWGTGKTFFLERWKAQLEKENYKVIYFNAWEDDFQQDPLLTIIGQIINKILKGPLKDSKNVIKQIKGSIGPALARIGLGIINGGIKSLTGVDISLVLEDIKKTDEQNLSDDYYMLCNTKNILKAELTALADTIYKDTGKPFIFIIDELDRCRPTFAIETLERVKHLFHIKNMIFVLGIARVSLEKSIRSVYGCINTFDYLHRFIDFEFNLPMIENKVFFEALWKRFQIEKFIEERKENWKATIEKSGETKEINHEMIRIFNEELNSFKECFSFMLEWHKFTLREIEQCMKLCALALQEFEKRRAELILIVILVILKIKFPKLYTQYLNGESSPSEISNKLIHSNQDNNSELRIGNLLTVIIYVTFSNRNKFYKEKIQDLFNTIFDLLNETKENEKDIRIFDDSITSDFLKKQCEYQIDSFSPIRHFHAKKVLAIEELNFLWRNYAPVYKRETAITTEVFESITKKIDFSSTIIPT